MTLANKIVKYSNFFITKKRDSGDFYTYLNTKAPSNLHDAVLAVAGSGYPTDWDFVTFSSLLERLTEYTINNMDDIDNYRNEIVDSLVDIYTSDLTGWLHENINNVYFLTQAIEEFDTKDGFKALALAQYLAIDEVMNYVIQALS